MDGDRSPTTAPQPGESSTDRRIGPGDGVVLAERHDALLSVAESITSCREPEKLFRRLAGELQRVVSFDFLAVSMYEPGPGVFSVRLLDTATMALVPRPEAALEDSPPGWVIESQQPLIVTDTAVEARWPDVMTFVRQDGIASFFVLPLTTARRRLGALGFGRRVRATYTASEIDFAGKVAKLVAVAIENALNFDEAQATQRQLSAERDHLRLLLDVTDALVANLDLPGLIAAVSSSLQHAVPHEFTALALHDSGSGELVIGAIALRAGDGQRHEGRRIPVPESPSGRAFATRRTQVFGEAELTTRFAGPFPGLPDIGIRALCCVPLIVHDRALGTLDVGSVEPDAFTAPTVALIEEVARHVAMGVANAMAFREIAQLKDKLAEERLYLESEIRTEHPFDEIIGDSPALRHTLQQVEVVAPIDSTVLLLGETGTGKEILARAIHDRSSRRERTFVKINCAAIPSGLLESELFGHERGAFTGAIDRKIGRFEVADRGTLFLDEVGEIPLELQSKLLRVLQEQEFERIGSTKTIKVNVRLIAATNRDLFRMVEEQRFRDDLYYRLNVFPIDVPPLRERPDDVPALVRYFVHRLARPMNRHVEVIPTETLEALRRYPWPGNVRELANLIERAMILSRGRTLEVPLDQLGRHRPPAATGGRAGAPAQERARVLRALEEANWVLGGPRGAASRLGMKRTTLNSLMKRLGIARPANPPRSETDR
jgi:formate hydrogenlyase transcriptional activator